MGGYVLCCIVACGRCDQLRQSAGGKRGTLLAQFILGFSLFSAPNSSKFQGVCPTLSLALEFRGLRVWQSRLFGTFVSLCDVAEVVLTFFPSWRLQVGQKTVLTMVTVVALSGLMALLQPLLL